MYISDAQQSSVYWHMLHGCSADLANREVGDNGYIGEEFEGGWLVLVMGHLLTQCNHLRLEL